MENSVAIYITIAIAKISICVRKKETVKFLAKQKSVFSDNDWSSGTAVFIFTIAHASLIMYVVVVVEELLCHS